MVGGPPSPGAAATVPVMTIRVDQAEQIEHLLVICGYLLSHGADPVRAELAATLTVCDLEPGDVDRFLDTLRHNRRYLDARLASERRRTQDAPAGTQDLAGEATAVDAGAA